MIVSIFGCGPFTSSNYHQPVELSSPHWACWLAVNREQRVRNFLEL